MSAGIPADVQVVEKTDGPNEERGNRVPPQAAYHLAMWCSPAFAVKVTERIHDIRTKGFATAPGVEIDLKRREKAVLLPKAVTGELPARQH